MEVLPPPYHLPPGVQTVQKPREPRGEPSTTPPRPTLPYTCQTCFMTALTRPIYRPGEILRDKLITGLVNPSFCTFIKYSLSARIYGPINRRPACPSLPILVPGQRRQRGRSKALYVNMGRLSAAVVASAFQASCENIRL